jgi:hypothetical protein
MLFSCRDASRVMVDDTSGEWLPTDRGSAPPDLLCAVRPALAFLVAFENIELKLDFSTPLGHLQAMFRNTVYRMRTMPKMFIVLGELVMRSQRHPELEGAMRRMDEQWMHYLGWILAEGVAQGQFRADLELETTAKKIIVVVKGVTFSYVWSRQEVDFEGMLQIVEGLVLPEPGQGDV